MVEAYPSVKSNLDKKDPSGDNSKCDVGCNIGVVICDADRYIMVGCQLKSGHKGLHKNKGDILTITWKK